MMLGEHRGFLMANPAKLAATHVLAFAPTGSGTISSSRPLTGHRW
jgi:hypothetical protein